MVLYDFQKPYNQDDIKNEILEKFNSDKDSAEKKQNIAFSKKLLDRNQNLLFQDNNIQFQRKYFKNSDNLNSEYFIITPEKPEHTIYYFIGNLDNILLNIPSLEEQEKIVQQIEILETQITQAQKIIDAAPQQKQAILQKYL